MGDKLSLCIVMRQTFEDGSLNELQHRLEYQEKEERVLAKVGIQRSRVHAFSWGGQPLWSLQAVVRCVRNQGEGVWIPTLPLLSGEGAGPN